MGCDIHTHLEIKVASRWHHYSSPSIIRNYDLFTKMAGVRSGGSPIVPISMPKGLPEKLSVVTKIDYENWGLDAHSTSWFNAKEIKQLIDFHIRYTCNVPDHIPESQEDRYIAEKSRTNSKIRKHAYEVRSSWGYVFGCYISDFVENREELPKKLQDIRLVFWFDN